VHGADAFNVLHVFDLQLRWNMDESGQCVGAHFSVIRKPISLPDFLIPVQH